MDGHFQKACGIRQECLRHIDVPENLWENLSA
jgi:hypothetical protein